MSSLPQLRDKTLHWAMQLGLAIDELRRTETYVSSRLGGWLRFRINANLTIQLPPTLL